MVCPVLKDRLLLDDIQVAAPAGHFHLWWLGQSGFLIKWEDQYILLDPYLSDSLTEKYAGTQREHVRMTERCIDPGALGFVSFVTASHAHTDHLDAGTLGPLADRIAAQGRSLRLVLPAAAMTAARARVGERRVDFITLDAGRTAQLGPCSISAVPAAHTTLECDDAGRHLCLGYLLRLGPWTIYHSGDTVRYDALPAHLEPFQVDVALLPINGNDPKRGVAGNLNGPEAAALAKECGASMVIPHHFEMFEFNTSTPDAFVEECQRLGQHYRVLRCGERCSSTDLIPRAPRP